MTNNSGINEKLIDIYKNLTRSEENIGNRHKNLSDEVYEIVKDKIISHEFKPGQRVIDKHIAEDLGVSRSLVRQAFNILEKEELIESIPRSGFFVREISEKDVKEIYHIRNLLETEATRLAVPRLQEKHIKRLEKIFVDAREELKKGEVKKLIEADATLHDTLIKKCGNSRLVSMIEKYSSHYVFYRIIDLSEIERARDAYDEHYKIFAAVKNEDIKLAADLMSAHIENAKNIILNNFKKYTFG